MPNHREPQIPISFEADGSLYEASVQYTEDDSFDSLLFATEVDLPPKFVNITMMDGSVRQDGIAALSITAMHGGGDAAAVTLFTQDPEITSTMNGTIDNPFPDEVRDLAVQSVQDYRHTSSQIRN